MKLIFFNRFFFPDTSATSQIVSDLAFHLASAGHEVHVVTSRVPGGDATLEELRGVHIHRVAKAIHGPHGLLRRATAYLHFYRGAREAARRLVQTGDVVVLKTDPPLLSVALGPLVRRRGAKVVAWLQDIFPEVAREYGVPAMGWPLGSVLRHARNRSLREADQVVVIGHRMAQRLARDENIPRKSVQVIHNWADGEAIRPLEPAANALRRAWKLEPYFVVGYSGNLGRVHEFDTILDAAARLKADSGIRFLIIGRGPRLPEVKARAEREGLPNVRFEEHQERGALAESLGAADVHLSVLKPGFEGLVHPSKLYGIMAAGRPTVFIGAPTGETASILADTQAGLTVQSGDAQGLASALLSLRDHPDVRERMGESARRAFEERFSMSIAIQKWESLLKTLS